MSVKQNQSNKIAYNAYMYGLRPLKAQKITNTNKPFLLFFGRQKSRTIMRTIKFRGQRIDNDEWIYGSLNLRENGEAVIHVNNKTLPYNAKLVNPKTVGQFTGFVDSNGCEVYEGDTMFNSNGLGKGEVRWYAPSFIIVYPHVDNYALTLDEDFDTCEVNGNIFESEGKIKEKINIDAVGD